MAELILDSFKYSVKAPSEKDYYLCTFIENRKIRICEGQLLYRVAYEGRGYWFHGRVVKILDDSFILEELVLRKTYELSLHHEPLGVIRYPEARTLIFEPYYIFNKKPNFNNIERLISQGDIFWPKAGPGDRNPTESELSEYQHYLPNLVFDKQLTIFES